MTLGYLEELILPAVFKRRDAEGKARSVKVPEYFKRPQIPWQTVIKRKNFQCWERQTAFFVLPNFVHFLCNCNRNFCRISALYLSHICSCIHTPPNAHKMESIVVEQMRMVVYVCVGKGRHLGLDRDRNCSD